MKVILDTNFVISCLLKKIDFLTELRYLGFEPVVPKEILEELKDLKKNDKISHEERVAIGLALNLLENKKIKKTKLGHKNVDDGLIEKGKQGYYIATLDSAIKRNIPNKIVILSAQKKLGVERS